MCYFARICKSSIQACVSCCIFIFNLPSNCVQFLCFCVSAIKRAVQFVCWLACCVVTKSVVFVVGMGLGMIYYHHLLARIPFPGESGAVFGFALSWLLGLGNVICSQLACISLLTVPVTCGKPGRAVSKVMVLTLVIAGPITNMALNAKEVVRVFACSNQAAYELYHRSAGPATYHLMSLAGDINELTDALRSIRKVISPIRTEVELEQEIYESKRFNDNVDDLFGNMHRSDSIEEKFSRASSPSDPLKDKYQRLYKKKLEYRCQNQISEAMQNCIDIFQNKMQYCKDVTPKDAVRFFCPSLDSKFMCNFVNKLDVNICDIGRELNPGLQDIYAFLKQMTRALANKTVKVDPKEGHDSVLLKIQDASETGKLVLQDFEEKMVIMQAGITAVNIFVAILCLRIFAAAVRYHDDYLTSIEYDNVYVTGYFKRIDKRRRDKNKAYLLPLKKMERSRYIDVYSLRWLPKEYNKLFTQVLKVMLEVITATTFVMLDRLFYEALDVVRQHAESIRKQAHLQNLNVKVDGFGIFAGMVTKTLNYLVDPQRPALGHARCIPQPRLMPARYFLIIYGGYCWILLLVCLHPYTTRLQRLICSCFYPRREKQRILHLYNDLLKKRFKMQKTLRRNAVQAVRAHYLSGENMLSMRMKFPQILSWLSVFPAARMACLICGETEPRNKRAEQSKEKWHSCATSRCPFVFCDECWLEVGERCLACDPSLPELSDVDSLSDDELPRY